MVSAAILAALAACAPETHRGVGLVEAVDAEQRQALVSHEDMPGLMPAMTMNFDVPDPEVFARLAPGQRIEFELQADGRVFRIVDVRVVGQASVSEGWVSLGDELVRFGEAPPFAGVDQSGGALSLADLRGRVVLLDFIFTHCPGPCPVLTSRHVDVQRRLGPRVRAGSHFVSITLDPERDRPEALRRYAEARGVDLDHWSFVTGEPEAIAKVLEAYGIGRVFGEDGDIEHIVGSFLIDTEGRSVRRYLGTEHAAAALAADVAALVPEERS